MHFNAFRCITNSEVQSLHGINCFITPSIDLRACGNLLYFYKFPVKYRYIKKHSIYGGELRLRIYSTHNIILRINFNSVFYTSHANVCPPVKLKSIRHNILLHFSFYSCFSCYSVIEYNNDNIAIEPSGME